MENDNQIILQAIGKAIEYRSTFFAYRMPGEQDLHFGAQIIDSHIPIGFYIHPFVESIDSPMTYISAQFDARKYLQLRLNKVSGKAITCQSTAKSEYFAKVGATIEKLRRGDLQKVVLSRVIVGDTGRRWVDVYCDMLKAYPQAFVFVFNSEDTGFWIGASPERFLSCSDGKVSTMALAGTRKAGAEGEWSEKNIAEQQFVCSHIRSQFEAIGVECAEGQRYTKTAGNVQHLCTEFSANVRGWSQVEKLRSLLHPTPALAGTPTKQAVKHITDTESHSRRYYGGYIGPIDARGNFSYFVNLRSMQFCDSRYCVFAGGGITNKSVVEEEWEETENKVSPLIKLLENE